MPDTDSELLALTQKLLDAVDGQDWETYCELCDPSLSAFEPEAVGNLVGGMEFHRIYFESNRRGVTLKSTISSPHLRIMGETAVVCYIRLRQRVDAEGAHSTTANEETRVWQRQAGRWRHVHFHRTKSGFVEL